MALDVKANENSLEQDLGCPSYPPYQCRPSEMFPLAASQGEPDRADRPYETCICGDLVEPRDPAGVLPAIAQHL